MERVEEKDDKGFFDLVDSPSSLNLRERGDRRAGRGSFSLLGCLFSALSAPSAVRPSLPVAVTVTATRFVDQEIARPHGTRSIERLASSGTRAVHAQRLGVGGSVLFVRQLPA